MKRTIFSAIATMFAVSLATTASAQILITQVVDGRLAGGTPKAYELTNVGTTNAPLANLELQFTFNANPTPTPGSSIVLTTALTPLTALTPGQVVTFTASGSDDEFLAITGFSPTAIGGGSVNGNDKVILVDTTGPTVLDILGVVGDATNFYVDSSIVRNANVLSQNATYTASEWTVTLISGTDLAAHVTDIGSSATGNNRLGFHTASASTSPEADVTLNSIPVADEATGVDLGNFTAGTGLQNVVFTLTNNGTANLLGSALSVTGTGFVNGSPAFEPTLAPTESTTFTVQVDTTNVGVLVGNVSFTTNDPDENPYNFGITAEVELIATNTPVFTALSTSNTTVRVTFDTAPLNGGETTAGNYSLGAGTAVSVANVSAGVYDVTFPTLTGDLTLDTLVFNNGVDASANDSFFAGIVPLSTIRAAVLADPNFTPTITGPGETITITGIIVENTIDPDEIRVQQGTSGITLFDGANGSTTDFIIPVALGDEVVFAGQLGYFNGLLQMIAPTYGNTIANSQPLPAYTIINTLTATAADYEAAESTLATFTNVTFVAGGQRDPGAAWGTGNANVNINSSPLSIVRRDSDIPVTGNVPTTPNGSVSGIVSQFDNSAPATETYQVIPTIGDADFNFPSSVNNWMLHSF